MELDEEDVASEMEFWDTGLIMFAVRGELSLTAVKQFMSKVWNIVFLPTQYYHHRKI